MDKNQIALLVDREMDLPLEVTNKKHVYVLPNRASYNPATIMENGRNTEICSKAEVVEVLEHIKKDGYKYVLVLTISNNIRKMSEGVSDVLNDSTLKIKIIDTLNIGIAAGMNAILASKYIEMGMLFDELYEKTKSNCCNVKAFFLISPNEQERIAQTINIITPPIDTTTGFEPIISCNEQGDCYYIGKGKGKSKCIEKLLDLAIEYASIGKKYNIMLYYSEENEMVEQERLLQRLPRCEMYAEKQINKELALYTESGMMGIAVQLLND